MTSFKHPPLQDPTRQIRLLRLLPTNDINDIRCSLHAFDLDNEFLRYVAISYTWGPEQPLYDILVNGEAARVRFNCWYALRQMKLRLSPHDIDCAYGSAPRRETSFPDLVWIDSICIQQSALAEKSLQVARMGDIYMQARMVAMCIGEHGIDGSLFNVCSCSKGLAFEKCQVTADMAGLHLADNSPPGEASSKEPGNSSIEFFSRRAYFSRLWTVQECLHARAIEVFCGRGFMAWSNLSQNFQSMISADDNLNGDATDDVFQLMKDRDNDYYANLSPTWDLRRDSSIQRAHITLPYLVLRYARRQCHEFRDKVFGFLSLISTTAQRQLRPDYSRSLLDILLDFAGLYSMVGLGGLQYERDTSMTQKGSLGYLLQSLGLLANEFSQSDEFMADLTELFCVERDGDGPIECGEILARRVDIEVYGTYYRIGASDCDRLNIIMLDTEHGHSTDAEAAAPQRTAHTPNTTADNFSWLLEASTAQTSERKSFVRYGPRGNAPNVLLGFAVPTSTQPDDVICTVRYSIPSDDPDHSEDVMYLTCRDSLGDDNKMHILGLAKPLGKNPENETGEGRISGHLSFSVEQLLAFTLLYQSGSKCDVPCGVADPLPKLHVKRRRELRPLSQRQS